MIFSFQWRDLFLTLECCLECILTLSGMFASLWFDESCEIFSSSLSRSVRRRRWKSASGRVWCWRWAAVEHDEMVARIDTQNRMAVYIVDRLRSRDEGRMWFIIWNATWMMYVWQWQKWTFTAWTTWRMQSRTPRTPRVNDHSMKRVKASSQP